MSLDVVSQWIQTLVNRARFASIDVVLDELVGRGDSELAAGIEAVLWATARLQVRRQLGGLAGEIDVVEAASILYPMAPGRAGCDVSIQEWRATLGGAAGDMLAALPESQLRRIQLLSVLVSLLEIPENPIPMPIADIEEEFKRIDVEATNARKALRKKWRKWSPRRWGDLQS